MTVILPRLLIALLSIATAASLPRPANADGAPSIALFGSFFPGWLLALATGVFATILIRFFLVVVKLDDILPLRMPVYMTMAVGLTFGLNTLMFGR